MKNILVVLLCAIAFKSYTQPNLLKLDNYEGQIYLTSFENLKVHTYVANDVLATNSHIFETKNFLLIHDLQQTKNACMELKKYIGSIKKEVRAIYISHEHEDHWLGTCYFKEYPVYATPSVINYIKREGPEIFKNKQVQLADEMPEEFIIPNLEIEFGDELIDGVIFRNYINEEGAPVFLELPLQKILVTHHFFPYGIHPFLPIDIDERITSLRKTKEKKYNLLLSGHGRPAVNKNLDEFITYLQNAQSIINNPPSVEDIKQNLIELQPHWKGDILLDWSLPQFFKNQEYFSLNTTDNLKLNGYSTKPTTYQGLYCIEAFFDYETNVESYISIPEVSFSNGTIELEVLGMPGPHAGSMARGFIGVAFRIQNDSTYECIYLRPENGRADNMLRRNHSVQYTSHPDYPWHVLRKNNPGLYETYYDLTPNSWTKMKIVVDGQNAKLFLNDSKEPVLIVQDLKLGEDIKGYVGLWIGSGTMARFRNLVITHN